MKGKAGGGNNNSSKGDSDNLTGDNNRFYYLAAAATTGLAGLIHLALVVNATSHNVFTNTITLFLIGGIAQLLGLFQF